MVFYLLTAGAMASLADLQRWVMNTLRTCSLSPQYDFTTDWIIEDARLIENQQDDVHFK